jgi:hypothetical protein
LAVWEIIFIFAGIKEIRETIMATTTAKQDAAHPISYYWNQVKDMDNSQKLELVTMLIDSVKPIQTRSLTDAFEEEVFSDMGKELYSPEEAYEMTMKDIKAIYDHKDAV